MQEFSLMMTDGKEMKGRVWKATKERAVVQIVPGAFEHAMRYLTFAQWLNGRGITVYALDNRGHGLNQPPGRKIVLMDDNASKQIPQDVLSVGQHIREQYPELPLILLGHSMGSFIARVVAAYENPYDKFIFVGSGTQPDLLLFGGLLLTKFLRKVKGRDSTSELLDNLSFKSLKRSMRKKKLINDDMEWLTSDQAATERNKTDSFLNQNFSINAYMALFNLVKESQSDETIRKTNKPVLFLSGKNDPTGGYTEDLQVLADKIRVMGENFVQEHYYVNMRHEVLNETRKFEVYRDLEDFIFGET